MIEIPTFDITNTIPWTGIVVHHSATKDSKLNDWEGIKKFHTSYRFNGDIITKEQAENMLANGEQRVLKPWASIGYHFGLERINDALQVMIGRPLSMVGAHAKGFNHTHIGVCIVGDFDKAAPSEDVWEAAIKLVRGIMYTFRLSNTSILGHRETFKIRNVEVSKSCPGNLFPLEEFRNSL